MKNIITAITVLFAVSLYSFSTMAKDEDHKSHKMNKKHEMNHSDHEGHGDHKDHKHEDTTATAKKIAKDKMLIKVKGMVCAFCAQGIKKNFNAKSEVKSTNVDLDKMEVLVTFKEGKSLSEATIKEVITEAGFQFVGVVE